VSEIRLFASGPWFGTSDSSTIDGGIGFSSVFGTTRGVGTASAGIVVVVDTGNVSFGGCISILGATASPAVSRVEGLTTIRAGAASAPVAISTTAGKGTNSCRAGKFFRAGRINV
jgi:adenosylcobinamide amidohydrolase